MSDALTFSPYMILSGDDHKFQKRNDQIDIVGLYQLIATAIQEYHKAVKIPVQYQARFFEDYPLDDHGKFDTRYNVITAGIKSRLRGNTGRAGDERRALGPTFQRAYRDNANPGHGIITESKFMDNYIKFTVHSTSKKSADMIALWLENMLSSSRHIILLAGISNYWFEERLEDRKEEILGTELFIRELVYFFRTEETYYYHTKTIDSVLFECTIAPRTQKIIVDGEEFTIYGSSKT